MTVAYYNEFEPFAADWLGNLARKGLIADGTIDRRSIADVSPDDVSGFGRVHFFAGIGGWEQALRLAGWPDDRPVWTGSCPCQPYSSAGKQLGDDDARNLWPEMFRLIAACRPECIFGEQVPGAIRHGWLDRVFADLEGKDYTCGAVVLGAHSVKRPHIRQRLCWVAYAGGERFREAGSRVARPGASIVPAGSIATGWMGDAGGDGSQGRSMRGGERRDECTAWEAGSFVECRDSKTRRVGAGVQPLAHGIPRDLGQGQPELRSLAKRASANRVGRLRGYGNAIVPQVAAIFIRAFMEATS